MVVACDVKKRGERCLHWPSKDWETPRLVDMGGLTRLSLILGLGVGKVESKPPVTDLARMSEIRCQKQWAKLAAALLLEVQAFRRSYSAAAQPVSNGAEGSLEVYYVLP